MLTLALLCAVLLGVGALFKGLFVLVGLVVRLALLPLTLLGWLLKGTFGLIVFVLAGVAGLLALLLVVPAVAIALLLPLLLPLGLVGLVVWLARRRPAVS